MSFDRRCFLKGLFAAPALAVIPVVAEATEKTLGSFSRAEPTALGGYATRDLMYNPHLVTGKQLGLEAISWDKIYATPTPFPPDSHAALALKDSNER